MFFSHADSQYSFRVSEEKYLSLLKEHVGRVDSFETLSIMLDQDSNEHVYLTYR